MFSPPLLVERSFRQWMLDVLATTVGAAFIPAVNVDDLGAYLDNRMNRSANTSVIIRSFLLSLSLYQPHKQLSVDKDKGNGR